MKKLFLSLSIFIAALLPAQTSSANQDSIYLNMPAGVFQALQVPSFSEKYELNPRLNPFYLRGDFNRDGKPDYAFLIRNRQTHKLGIGVTLSGRPSPIVLAAGVPVVAGSGKSDDFSWVDDWQAVEMRDVEQPDDDKRQIIRHGDGILVEKKESGGGVYYWNGRAFIWIQQGD